MTDVTTASPSERCARCSGEPSEDTRPYSPGLAGVIGAESAIALVDGARGRLLYRGYPIGQLVTRGTYAEVADLLWTGEWHPGAQLHPEPVPAAVLASLRELPHDAHPMDALRTAVSVWGATQKLTWPPTPEQARELTGFSPSALAAFGRLAAGPRAGRAGPLARPCRRLPPAADRGSRRTPPPPGPSRPTSSSAPSTA